MRNSVLPLKVSIRAEKRGGLIILALPTCLDQALINFIAYRLPDGYSVTPCCRSAALVCGLFKDGAHTNLTFGYFIRNFHNFFQYHPAPCVPDLFVHPRALVAISAAVFCYQNPHIRLKPTHIHVGDQVAEHSEELERADIIIKFSRSRYHDDIC